ncbi:MAG: ChbG/HpnK family deacetylase [Candidatus Endonucleobacter bathymodioli]|uniref:ChbG/HpnK family deacetylase n=1 Tax=Candidatus Endonucleibacter bathymodioli TaxID=539814 RepID=A0AA90NTB2_9GAMM|nr:ChbG/HpnK family deacetylase [Candidatus Endonucleobacter bathymodioli]
MKQISLCADDFAITPAVSKAILSLVNKNAIQAVSCMVTMPNWQIDASHLQEYYGQIDIGLHLNFTENTGLTSSYKTGFPSLAKILIMSHFRVLNYNQLLEEIHAQVNCFINTLGRYPDFIDGHQHVHHLPQIRKALLTVMKEKLPPDSTWVRSVSPLVYQKKSLKSIIIEGSGALSLRGALARSGYNTNTSFAGVYSLSPKESFRPLMQLWLRHLSDGGLIMCHPGEIDRDNGCSEKLEHADARQIEFDYLGSTKFTDDCQSAGIQLSKPSAIFKNICPITYS